MSRPAVDGIIESPSAECEQRPAARACDRHDAPTLCPPPSYPATSYPTTNCPATIDHQRAAQTEWDIAVIGAGPAGALAARQAALAGLRTLLVDKSAFP